MSTHTLPYYPLSGNRSYIPENINHLDSNVTHSHDDLQLRPPASFKQLDFRFYASPTRKSTDIPLHTALGEYIAQPTYDVDRARATEAYVGSRDNHDTTFPLIGDRHVPPSPEGVHYAPHHRAHHSEQYTATTPSASPSTPSEPIPPLKQPFDAPLSRTTSAKRKEKPQIQLAADQPLTSQGKPRTRVYVACVQCRGRKIRCDGAKPICHNCNRRAATTASVSPECSYDSAPKRRGPDRVPGARQRVNIQDTEDGGKVRKRRRRQHDLSSPDKELVNNVDSITKVGGAGEPDQQALRTSPIPGPAPAAQSQVPTKPTETSVQVGELDAPANSNDHLSTAGESDHLAGSSSFVPPHSVPVSEGGPLPQGEVQFTQPSPYYKHPVSQVGYVSYHTSPLVPGHAGEYGYEYGEDTEQKSEIGAEPSLRFTRDTWWDALLSLYCGHMHGQPPAHHSLTPGQRDSACQLIMSDLRQMFRASSYWFSFLNISRFFARIFDHNHRRTVQPSLVLASLAISTFIHSSEREAGSEGRAWAMRLRDEAQGALEASLSTRWIDESLVHAAWLIAFYEICAHPDHSKERVHSSLSMLDSLIRSLGLTQVDKGDPRVSIFPPHDVPLLPPPANLQQQQNHWDPSGTHLQPDAPREHCDCSSLTLGHNNPMAQQVTPCWLTTPAWGENWTEAEVRKEECRRVVWSSMMVAAGHSSYTAASGGFAQLDLFISDPANYAVLFPGETIMSPSDSARKDTVWALYMRTMLLWHSCIRMRRNHDVNHGDKARFAVNAWLEMDKIEEQLNRHTCNVERAFLFQGREYLFKMCISHEFSRFIPQATANANLLFHRKKAEDWLTHQAWVAKQVVNGLQTVTGQASVSIGKRPFFVFWFMSQIRRALTLWTCDRSLTVALDVSKALMGPIEFLMSLWPCPEQRRRYHDLIDTLVNACATAGLPVPQIYASAGSDTRSMIQ